MTDGRRRCALPGCDRVIAAVTGRPERRYCCAIHRMAARRARRTAMQVRRAGAAARLAVVSDATVSDGFDATLSDAALTEAALGLPVA